MEIVVKFEVKVQKSTYKMDFVNHSMHLSK